MSITDGLRVGDVVRHSRTMEVTFAADGGYVELRDTVDAGIRIGLYDGHRGSDKIKVVKKAKPSAGTVITGAELKATQWKRGTVIQSGSDADYVYMLHGDGKWHCSQYEGLGSSFTSFGDQEKLGLLHVA